MDTDVWHCYNMSEGLKKNRDDDITSSLAAKGFRSVRPNLQRPTIMSQIKVNGTANATGSSYSHQGPLSSQSPPSLSSTLSSPPPRSLSSPTPPSLSSPTPPSSVPSAMCSPSTPALLLDSFSEFRGYGGQSPVPPATSPALHLSRPTAAETELEPPTQYPIAGPVDQPQGTPNTARTTVERPKDWYKSMFKQIHMSHKTDTVAQAESPETQTHPRTQASFRPISKSASENDTAHLHCQKTPPSRSPSLAATAPSPISPPTTTTSRPRARDKERDRAWEPPDRKWDVTDKTWDVPDRKVDTRQYRAEPRSIFDYEPGNSSVLDPQRGRRPPKKYLDYSSESSHRGSIIHQGSAQTPFHHSAADRPTDKSASDSRRRRKSEPSQPLVRSGPGGSLASNPGPAGNNLPFGPGTPSWATRAQVEPSMVEPSRLDPHRADPFRRGSLANRSSDPAPSSPCLRQDAVRSTPASPNRARRDQGYTSSQSYADLDQHAPPTRKHYPDVQKQSARAVYDFKAQTMKELALRKGEIVHILRQIDKNWYEGERHGQIGIFPISYVERIAPSERPQPVRPPPPLQARELGEAVARYNFTADTPVELSLRKGDRVILMRQVDHNWFEGKLPDSGRHGIFPVSYVEMIRKSHYPHSSVSQSPSGDRLHPVGSAKRPAFNQEGMQCGGEPFQVLYNYAPRNEDELELREGEVVDVMEKCDDGWFVGTSRRSKFFGTFPGNYVRRL